MIEIGKLFHMSQVVDDLDVADAWFDKVFSPCRVYRDFLKAAMRDASWIMIGDAATNEVIALADRLGAAESPLGLWKARHGAGLHSPAWYVEDLDATWAHLQANGIRTSDVLGRAVETAEHMAKQPWLWTHPKDTHGSLEFARIPEFTIDVRLQPFWPKNWWRDEHPLRITGRFGWTTVVRDLDAAATIYGDLLGATPVAAPDGRRGFHVGPDTFVELTTSEESEAIAAFGDGLHGMIFLAADIEGAARHLSNIGVPASELEDGALVIAPEDALGTTITFRAA